ncbi:membrane-spanning 4-domains subfamily A member 4A-like isoform X2 [Sceloporus undulatus]|uniref:membrane-spanning 4-domains subfamily A member 4A-like isoform X2 n=1 Tax=Sceloporus undulatus TaxID=8520 RepID=UPI001C4B3A2A|nr:membrane-spanning 4-domains subfamily A member 4A-like isoform X2 [Sceloporus undulatus]
MSDAGLLLQKFLRGHPRVFGALLMVIGLIQVAFGVVLYIYPCVPRDELGTHFYSAALLIFAGILTLAADKTNSLGLVKACLTIYVISTIVVAVINVFYWIDLIYSPRNRDIKCSWSDPLCQMLHQIATCCTGMRGIVLVLTSLGFFIGISMAAFGCKAVCRQSTDNDDVPITAASRDFPSSTEVNREPEL